MITHVVTVVSNETCMLMSAVV